MPKAKKPKKLSPGEEAFALHCRADFYPANQPEREYIFHSLRKWRFDFAFPRIKVAVEIEGFGRHQRMAGFSKDMEKYNAAAKLGWRILRYTTAMAIRGDAINDMLELLKRDDFVPPVR